MSTVPGRTSGLGTSAIDNTSGPPSSLKTMALTASLLAAKCAPTDRRAQVSNPLHPRTRPSRSHRAGRLTPTPSSCRLRAFHDGASRGCPRVPPDADRAVLRRAGLADLLHPGAHARAVVYPSRPLRAARQLDRVQRQGHRPELRRHMVHHLQDRKSTRLNSSHSQISYAVFCLKKKKRDLDVAVAEPSVGMLTRTC